MVNAARWDQASTQPSLTFYTTCQCMYDATSLFCAFFLSILHITHTKMGNSIGWPAGDGGRARQDKLVQTVLSEHVDIGACHGSRGQPRQPAISRPHSTAYNSKDERPARTGHNTSRASRLPRLQDSPGDEAPGQPRR